MASLNQRENIILAANFVTAKMFHASKPTIDAIATFLSYQVAGSDHMGNKHWDGRSSFYSRRTDSFPAGFLHIVHDELRRLGHNVRLVIKDSVEPLGPASPVVDSFGNDDPRYDFQLEALRQVEKHKRGVVQVATGGGKSKIAKLIVARYRRMTLFLTTRGILMHQMAEGFREVGLNVGIIGDGELKLVRGVNCGMVQTFVAKLKEPDAYKETEALIDANAKLPAHARLSDEEMVIEANKRFKIKSEERAKYLKLLDMFEIVIGEEAHEAGGNSYYEILRHCKNASIRVALTATPFMREDAEDNMKLMAAFGPIVVKVSEKTLIDRGILATPYFRFHIAKRHPKLFRTTAWQNAYKYGYAENENLIRDIVDEAKKAAALGLRVMTLVTRTAHGKALEKAMRAAGVRVEFIRGENDQVERKRELTRLKEGKIDVLIGTTILDVGVDVPAVGLVQLAGGGKAEIALRQRIGRGLRAKKGMQNIAFITDYGVELNGHLLEHSAQRRAIIEQTEGFRERILPPGRDHNWDIFAAKTTL